MGFRTEGAEIRDTGVGEFPGPQPTQLTIDPTIVRQYAEQLIGGETVPPIDVVRLPDGREYITEGHHRYVAGQITGEPVERKVFPNSGPVGFTWKQVRF